MSLTKFNYQMPEIQKKSVAAEVCLEAAQAVQDRAKDRDDGSERSMKKTIELFHGVTGVSLTESQGWTFMMCLKLARHANGKGYNRDHFIDIAGYAGLLVESLENESD